MSKLKSLDDINLFLKRAGSTQETFKLTTPEEIDLKSRYKKEDLERVNHLGFRAGVAPFLGGPYATMYKTRPWTIRQLSLIHI